MDFCSWFDKMSGLASIYSFDIYPDGSFGDLLILAVNENNARVLSKIPDTPDFHPGIPWRTYYSEINHEKFCYRCGKENVPLYSYVNAHGFWIKGFYLPIPAPGELAQEKHSDGIRTAYLLYVMTRSEQVDADSMSQRDLEVSNAVINVGIKLHETQDYLKAMTEALRELNKICGSQFCTLYTVDRSSQKCELIDENGAKPETIQVMTDLMGRTPYEIALAWEQDLAGSDCLMLDTLDILKERDRVWYDSMVNYGLKNIILHSIRFNGTLVGFLWAANFDLDRKMQIKETLSLTTFIIAAVIANHQLMSKLEFKSNIDDLTQTGSQNSMKDRIDALISDKQSLPETMGVVYADLNGLKTVNDTEGHAAGDKLLSRAASLLKLAFGDHEIYRAGGDEFVVFCPDISNDELGHKTSQLRAMMEATDDVSFAIGTVWLKGEYDISSAIQTADARMYEDKNEYYRQHPEKDRRTTGSDR